MNNNINRIRWLCKSYFAHNGNFYQKHYIQNMYHFNDFLNTFVWTSNHWEHTQCGREMIPRSQWWHWNSYTIYIKIHVNIWNCTTEVSYIHEKMNEIFVIRIHNIPYQIFTLQTIECIITKYFSTPFLEYIFFPKHVAKKKIQFFSKTCS